MAEVTLVLDRSVAQQSPCFPHDTQELAIPCAGSWQVVTLADDTRLVRQGSGLGRLAGNQQVLNGRRVEDNERRYPFCGNRVQRLPSSHPEPDLLVWLNQGSLLRTLPQVFLDLGYIEFIDTRTALAPLAHYGDVLASRNRFAGQLVSVLALIRR